MPRIDSPRKGCEECDDIVDTEPGSVGFHSSYHYTLTRAEKDRLKRRQRIGFVWFGDDKPEE